MESPVPGDYERRGPPADIRTEWIHPLILLILAQGVFFGRIQLLLTHNGPLIPRGPENSNT